MANDDIRIVAQKEDTKFLQGGQTQRVITTLFMIGTDGPYSVSQPEDGFDPAQQHALILAKAGKLQAARNHPSFS